MEGPAPAAESTLTLAALTMPALTPRPLRNAAPAHLPASLPGIAAASPPRHNPVALRKPQDIVNNRYKYHFSNNTNNRRRVGGLVG